MKSRDGFVLIAVIFITGLLAITTTAFVADVRSNTLFARALLYNQQLEAAADGMARLVAFQIATRDQGKPVQTEFHCRWNTDIFTTVRIQDQGGLVDVNTASPDLLKSLIQGLGKSSVEADAIVSSIEDYKDADATTIQGEPETVSYQEGSVGPNDGPLVTVEELDRIPTIDEKLYKSILPFVTVHSQQTGFDPSTAPQFLLGALQIAGVGPDQLSRFASPTPARVYSISVIATRESGASFTRVSIISLTGQPDKPIATLKWSVSPASHRGLNLVEPTQLCVGKWAG